MKWIIFPAALILVLGACTPMKLALPDELKNQHDAYSVKGRQGILINQKLSFGSYATSKVKRSWTRGSSARHGIGWGGTAQQEWVNIISTEYVQKKQTVNFNLTNGHLESDVYCVSNFNARDLQIGRRENSILNISLDLAGLGGSSSSFYYVQVFTQPDDAPWQLVLDNQAVHAQSKTYVGVLAKSRSEYYTLVPVTKLEKNGKTGNTLLGSVGFEFRNQHGQAVAAVSMIDNGMVFLGKTTEAERFLLANVCAALLLQEQI